MKTVRHQSEAMQTARRDAANLLQKAGATVKASTTAAQLATMIAERTGWLAPVPTPAALLPFLMRYVELYRPDATPPPYRPLARRPLRYDLAMRVAAARAAAVQPRLVAAASNVITWRELSSLATNGGTCRW